MDQRSLYLLRQAVTAVFKRWRLVALVFLAIFVPFNFFNMIRPPVYSAKSKVLITKDRGYAEVSPLVRDMAATDLPNEMVVNSEIQLIQSRDLLRRLGEELETQSQADPDGAFSAPGLKALQQQVQVLRKPQSNVLEISYRSSDPDYAIHVVNTLVGLYTRYHIEAHKTPGALAFFDKETQAAKEAFVQSDLELERFDAANGLTSIATEVENRLRQRAQLEADLRRTEAQVAELTTKVAAVEAELEYIPEQEATEVEIIPNPLLVYLRQNLARLEMERERLLQLYTPQHRLVMDVESEIAGLKSQIAGQEGTVVGRKKMAATGVRRRLEEDLLGSQAQVGALEARRTLLAERISDYENQIRVLHGKHYEIMRMRREREEHKKTYGALLDKLNTMRVSEAMDMAGLSNVSVIEAAAAPLDREADYKTITLALTTFLALLLSVSAAVVFEMVNPVMNSDLDVRHHLGLPVLAAIPLNGGTGGPGNNLQGNVQGNLQGNVQGNVGNGYRVGNARRSGNRRGNNGNNGNGGNGGRRS